MPLRGQRKTHPSLAGLAWGAGSFALMFILWMTPPVNAPLRRAEAILYDLRLRSRRVPPPGRQVAMVCVCKEDEDELGPLPWPRGRYAELVRRLARAGVKAIAFDMYFDQPDAKDPAGDREFAQAIRDAGMAYLSEFCRGRMSAPAPLWRWLTGRPAPQVYMGPVERNIEPLRAAAAGVGHINVMNDEEDSLVRRLIGLVAAPGAPALFPTSLLAALRALGVSSEPRVEGREIRAGVVRIPLDSLNCIPVNYLRFDRDVYVRQPDAPAFVHQQGLRKPIILYSAREVLGDPSRPACREAMQELRGKAVIVGATVQGSELDVHSTPMGRQFGVFVQAAFMHSVLNGRLIRIPAEATTLIWLAVYSLVLGFLAFSIRVRGSAYTLVVGAVAGMLAAGVALIWLSIMLYNQRGLMIHIAPFVALLAMQVTAGLSFNLSRARRETEAKKHEVDVLIRVGEAASGAEAESFDSPSSAALTEGRRMTASLTAKPGAAGRRILESLAGSLSCRGAALYALDSASGRLRLAAVTGLEHVKRAAALQRFSDTLNAQLQAAPRPILIENAPQAAGESADALGAEAVLAAPIRLRGEVIGAIHIYDRLDGSAVVPFSDEDRRLLDAAAQQTAVALDNERLYAEMHEIFIDYIRSMAAAIDARDRYTHGHSQRVALFSVGLARQLGLQGADIELVELAATVHDVGKIGVPEHILNKPGKLTEEEFAQIQAHVTKGADIISEMAKLRALVPGVRHHHERFDGQGYPDQLAGQDIPLMARIISVADAFDAMISDRVYRPGMPREKAIEELRRSAGRHFDPAITDAFITYAEALELEALGIAPQ